MTQQISDEELQLAAKNASYELARCQSLIDGWSHNLLLDLIDARARIEMLEKALEFYADESKWIEDYADFGGRPVKVPGTDEASFDHGDRARAALAQAEEGK